MHRQFWITAVMRWAGLEMPPPFVPVCHFGLTRTCGGLSPQVFLASLRPLARTERMPKMKIRVKYYGLDESKAPLTTEVEVTEEECQIMVERDYELRKQAAKEGEEVTRRSAQEIMNEDFNKPLYNDWHREHRRRSEFPDYQGRDEEDISLANPIEDAPDTCGCAVAGSGCKRNGKAMPDMSLVSRDEVERDREASDEETKQTIRIALAKKTEWAEAVIAVYIDGESVRAYAARTGANENNITQKLKRAKKKLQEFFGNRQI